MKNRYVLLLSNQEIIIVFYFRLLKEMLVLEPGYLNVSGENLYSQKIGFTGLPGQRHKFLLICFFEVFLLCEVLIFLIMINFVYERKLERLEDYSLSK